MDESLLIKGTVTKVGDTEQIGAKGFEKRIIRVRTDGEYPQEHDIEAVKDKTDLLDKFKEGDKVHVSCNLRGNYWKGGDRCFTSLSLWKITPANEDTDYAQTAANETVDDLDEDVPF